MLAVFEEQEPPRGGDGASGSSAGTQSPEAFSREAERAGVTGFCLYQLGSEIEVTPSALRTRNMQHMHGIRKSINVITTLACWIMANNVNEDNPSNCVPTHWTETCKMTPPLTPGSPLSTFTKAEKNYQSTSVEGHAGGGAFQRVAARSSLSAAHPMVDRWLERQDQHKDDGECEERSDDRMDPVGHADYSQKHTHNTGTCSDMVQLVEIPNDGGPLGIHLVPFLSSSSSTGPISVCRLNEDLCAWRDGLLSTNDAIIAINSRQLLDIGFELAQQLFRHAMQCSVIRLWVVPAAQREAYERDLSSPASPASPASPSSRAAFLRPRPFPWGEVSPCGAAGDQVHRAPCSQSLPTFPCTVAAIAAPLANVQAERASSPVVPRRHSGRRFRVQLQKGPEGLGFSLTSRDTPVSGLGHVYIKHILPRGAAIADGRLHAGDRLIMVNGVDVSSMSQDQVVSILRGVHPGSSVDLLVSRHDALLTPPAQEARLVKQMHPDQQAERSGGMIVTASGPCECLNLEIALSECGPAGLGVSVKGNRSRDGAHDLGIYVKSIIAGGAAAKDGRLRIGDQLVAVNREPLLGRSNAAAMETLRRCMATDGSERGRIHLAVARRAS
uniref:PDZ domain-containing protein n=1 Tax=Petromyzon marinus TaxID=7757 RepID=S4RAG3_PETMA